MKNANRLDPDMNDITAFQKRKQASHLPLTEKKKEHVDDLLFFCYPTESIGNRVNQFSVLNDWTASHK